VIEIFTYKRFNPLTIQLQPLEKRQLQVKFSCKDTGIFVQNIEFTVKDGLRHVVEVYAEVQEVYVSLNRYQLFFQELYLGEQYEILKASEQAIVLMNRGFKIYRVFKICEFISK